MVALEALVWIADEWMDGWMDGWVVGASSVLPTQTPNLDWLDGLAGLGTWVLFGCIYIYVNVYEWVGG